MPKFTVAYGGGDCGGEPRLHPLERDGGFPIIELTDDEAADYRATMEAYERWEDRLFKALDDHRAARQRRLREQPSPLANWDGRWTQEFTPEERAEYKRLYGKKP